MNQHFLWISAILLYLLVNIYLFIRGWQVFSAKSLFQILFILVFISGPISIITGFLIKSDVTNKYLNICRLIAGYWIIFYPFLLVATIFADLMRILNRYFGIFPGWLTKHLSQIKKLYVGTIILVMLVFSLQGYGSYAKPEITTLNLSLEKATTNIDDLKVVVVSDLHIGYISGQKRLGKWIDTINDLNSDIILLVGDVFDRYFDESESTAIIKELNRLSSKLGTYAVFGNHDYHYGIENFADHLQQADITVLNEETDTIMNELIIVGRDDLSTYPRKWLNEILMDPDSAYTIIVMDHQPYHYALKESVMSAADLHVSGHLHDGQIFPYNLFLRKTHELSYGYLKKKNTHFYVTSGLGVNLVPLRFGTHSEIVVFNLSFKNTAIN